MPLATIAFGSFLIDSLKVHNPSPSKNRRVTWLMACLLALQLTLMGPYVSLNTAVNWMKTGSLPSYPFEILGKSIQDNYLTENDVVATWHVVIWGMPYARNLVSFGAEGQASMGQRSLISSPITLWESVKPTIIVQINDYSTIPPGLKMYMEEHHFGLCQQPDIAGFRLEIYRERC
jgi:hypothetical protein